MKSLRVTQLPYRPAKYIHAFRYSNQPLGRTQWVTRQCFQRSRSFGSVSAVDSKIDRIKIRRKFFTWRRLTLLILYTAGPFFLISYVFGRLFEEDILEEEEEDDDDYNEAEDKVENGLERGGLTGSSMRKDSVQFGDKDSIFIPFQYPKKLPPKFYKHSDPEWQAFVSISHNAKRQHALIEELAMAVARDLAKFPKIKIALGNDIKLNRTWLEIKYPDGPPPDYARKGLLFTDEYIAWSTQIIPHAHYIHLQHILWPQAVFKAAWYTVKVFYAIQTFRFKTVLGVDLNEQDRGVRSLIATEKSIRELLKQQEDAKDSPADSSDPKHSNQTGANSSRWVHPPIPTRPPSSPTSFTAGSPTGQGPGSTTTVNIDATGHNAPIDLAISLKTFLAILRKQWSATKQDKLPRGCFAVLGQIEVMGTRGRAKCEVFGAYDPKANKYVYVTATLQHYWELNQSAKGGP